MSITPLPSAPAVTDTTAEFNTKAFAWVAALGDFTTEANALADQVEADADTASTAATNAAESENAAVSAANYKGEWSDLTGSLAVPASVSHNGYIYLLTENLANVTTDEPGVTSPSKWLQIYNANPVPTGPTTTIVASGSLSSGDKVIINTDGTCSVVSGVNSGSGSKTTYKTGNIEYPAIGYDPYNNKVVIAYRDTGNSNYGTAIVGTVSGTSISFGSPVVFNSSATYCNPPFPLIFDSTGNKIIIPFWISNAGQAIVGTVSGTSISFGTATTFYSAAGAGWWARGCYDTVNQKVVLTYGGYPTNDSTTDHYAIIGTVTGTSISFGSAVVANIYNDMDFGNTVFDSSTSKFYLTSRVESRVGTVSGNSCSFGSATNWDSTLNGVSNAYGGGYHLITNGSSYYVVQISGTSVSIVSSGAVKDSQNTSLSTFSYVMYDSTRSQFLLVGASQCLPVSIVGGVFTPSKIISTGIGAIDANLAGIHDDNSQTNVFSYIQSSNGVSSTFTIGTTNITAENFIGTSQSNYSNGQTATIKLVGSVDENQTGLTAGQKYYVQNNGSLATTEADPSVYAGTAISATKIIVKG